MYEAFDHFLDADTWHTGHAFDLERFNQALAKVVRDPKFNADQMAEYMRARKGVQADDDEHPFWSAINSRRDAAWAVREYLETNQLL